MPDNKIVSQSQFKVHRDRHERKIATVKSRVEQIFFILKKENIVNNFTLTKDGYDSRFQVCRLQYSCTIPFLTTRAVEINLEIDMRGTHREIEEVKNNASCSKLTLSAFFDGNIMRRILRNRIRKWTNGARAEYLFYELFLKPLQGTSRILSAYHVNAREDKFSGVDFVVRLITRPHFSIEEVKFNLKTSHRYLEKHIIKYPKISTFLFSLEDLKKKEQLQRRFFRFLYTVQFEVCHL